MRPDTCCERPAPVISESPNVSTTTSHSFLRAADRSPRLVTYVGPVRRQVRPSTTVASHFCGCGSAPDGRRLDAGDASGSRRRRPAGRAAVAGRRDGRAGAGYRARSARCVSCRAAPLSSRRLPRAHGREKGMRIERERSERRVIHWTSWRTRWACHLPRWST